LRKNSSKIIIQIRDEMLGQRLDKALGLIPEIGTRSRAEYLIDKGAVLLNKKIIYKASYKIQASDIIEINLPTAEDSNLLPLEMELEILYEDNDIIVINKPAGLVVHPAAGHQQDTLVNALLHHTANLSMKFGENRPGIVHRLDKDTSGILVVAKNDLAHENLALQFKEKTAHRIYHAISFGDKTVSLEGTIQSYLARHPTNRKKIASIKGSDKKIIRKKVIGSEPPGRWAVTHFKVIQSLPGGVQYLQLKLETGRTHQIRVHLSEMGMPIVADDIYGSENRLKNLKDKKLREVVDKMPRLALHAAELGFLHPRTKERMFFKKDWPAEEKEVINKLGFSV
jgi:23S rRNA pseudouridine1911/1915/1917 synthase